MLKIGIFGASGRIGRLIIDEILSAPNKLEIGAIFVRKELDFSLPEGSFVTNNIDEFIRCCDVIIDFSSPAATQLLLKSLLHTPKPCVIGTTGLDDSQKSLMQEVSKKAPLLYATNMSIGIALLNTIIANITKALPNADIEISEIHHRFKKDAPSGTALTLAESCAKARGFALNEVMVTERKNERKPNEIGVVSLRGGDVSGRHTIGFYMDGEFLEFTHNATSRKVFAKGAITCALWLCDKAPNLYSINQVLEVE